VTIAGYPNDYRQRHPIAIRKPTVGVIFVATRVAAFPLRSAPT